MAQCPETAVGRLAAVVFSLVLFSSAILAQPAGDITIIKDARPDSPDVFDFTGDLGMFQLVDDGIVNPSISFSGLTPGTYLVTELVPVDWNLQSITCIDPDNGTTTDRQTATATIDLDAGEEIFCTFVDVVRLHTGPPTVTIVKEANPHDPQVFNFSGDLGNFVLVDDGTVANSVTFSPVMPGMGPFTVTEAVPSGWTLTEIACDDPDGGTTFDPNTGSAELDVDRGEHVICTFFNEKLGSITITKSARPQGPQAFGFSGDLGNFSLVDDGVSNNSMTFSDLPAGVYQVSEEMLADWELANLVCQDPDGETTRDLPNRTVTIDLDPGEEVNCTYYNRFPEPIPLLDAWGLLLLLVLLPVAAWRFLTSA